MGNTKLKIPEKLIETSILDFLRAKKVFAWKNQSIGVFDTQKGIFRKSRNPHAINGVSDILGVFNAKFLAIEVKTPEAHRSILRNLDELKDYFGDDKKKNALREQINFIGHINYCGGKAFFASSIDDVKKELGL